MKDLHVRPIQAIVHGGAAPGPHQAGKVAGVQPRIVSRDTLERPHGLNQAAARIRNPDQRTTTKPDETLLAMMDQLNQRMSAKLNQVLAEISDIEKRLTELEAVISVGSAGQTAINVSGELRINAAKVSVNAPGGLSTVGLSAAHLSAAFVKTERVNCKQINNLRFIPLPPFITPSL